MFQWHKNKPTLAADHQNFSSEGSKTSLTVQWIKVWVTKALKPAWPYSGSSKSAVLTVHITKRKPTNKAPHSPLKIIARASTITQVLDAHKVVSIVADSVRNTALVHKLLPQQAASIRVRVRQWPVLVVLCCTPLTCMVTRQSEVLQHQAIMQRREVVKYTQGYSEYAWEQRTMPYKSGQQQVC